MEKEQQREGVEKWEEERKKENERLKTKIFLTYNENVFGKGFSWVAVCCKSKTPRTDLALVR